MKIHPFHLPWIRARPYRSYFLVSVLTTFLYTGSRGPVSEIIAKKKILWHPEGTQSRVSINRSDGLNFKKYGIPDRIERVKSSLELLFINSLLYGTYNKLLGPGSGEN